MANRACAEDVSKYISEWEHSSTSSRLYEYLGMTEDEYFLWVNKEQTLEQIIENRRTKYRCKGKKK